MAYLTVWTSTSSNLCCYTTMWKSKVKTQKI